MSDTKRYLCPHCGAVLNYKPGTQSVKCEGCGTEIPVNELNAVGDRLESAFDWKQFRSSFVQKDTSSKVYHCQSCGAKLETDENTVAVKCPYCEGSTLIDERMEGGLRPNVILPFAITPKELPAAIKKFYKNKKLLPGGFFNSSALSKIQGIYVPFWLFSGRVSGNLTLNATKVRRYSDSNYDYTETSEFRLERSGEMSFDKIPVDASVRMDNSTMDSLEPFDFEKLADFNDAYMSGYLADRFDSDPEAELPRGNYRMMSSVENAFVNSEFGYNTVRVESNNMKLDNVDVKYALLPVYLLHCHYNGKNYPYAVNGQTGKVIGELPISTGRAVTSFLAAFGIAFAAVAVIYTILYLGGYIL